MTEPASRRPLSDGFLLSVGTLTALPVPPPSAVDHRRAGLAMVLAPVAAVPLGVLAGAVAAVGALAGLPSVLVGALVVGAVALATRVIHLDGLADTADGLSAPYDRDRRLAIMKSGDVGPAGVVTIVLVLLVQAAALGTLAGRSHGWLLVGVLVCASRAATVIVCARPVPAATPGGLGAAVAGSVPLVAGALVGAAVAVALAGVLVATGALWWQGALAVVVAGVVIAGLVRRAVTILGGITGDVIGASVEVALAVLCVAVLV